MNGEKKKLVVILGAGATAGSVVPHETSGHDWQPPITKEIFSIRFDNISDNYPYVKNLSAGLSAEVKDGLELENHLLGRLKARKDYQQLSFNRRSQLQELPLYLQQLFHHITQQFSRKNLYSRFVGELIDQSLEITLVSLNYDLMLDIALEDACQMKFSSFDKYLNFLDQWAYLKVHGSINWFYKIVNHKQTGSNLESWKAVANEIDLYKNLTPGLELLDLDNQFKEGYVEAAAYYPALSIPNGDYYFVLPDKTFEDSLANRLSDNKNYLVIGFSGYAKDLLEFLNTNVKSVDSFLIVGNGRADETYKNMTAIAPIFRRDKPEMSFYNAGFAKFVRSADCSNFLTSLL